uniref:Neurexin 2 n=1 Tax=Ursus americanus TaxID=9643 RepID=A0A452RMY8_URSAM
MSLQPSLPSRDSLLTPLLWFFRGPLAFSFSLHSPDFSRRKELHPRDLLPHRLLLLFGGGPGQWARYARWAGAASSGELSFSLRTNATRALLLYLDDGGDCDFLELLLVDGRLRLRFTLSCAEPATLQLDTPVADDRWHMVLLTRDARRTALAVDGEARAAEVRSKRREMQVASDLFVGGIPPDVRLSALTLSTVKYEPPFRGLLANLKLGERPPALLGSQGLRGAAADPLCAPARNPCANGGLCTVLAPGEVGCDCSHTGFGGKFCSEGEPPGSRRWAPGLGSEGLPALVRGRGLRGCGRREGSGLRTCDSVHEHARVMRRVLARGG